MFERLNEIFIGRFIIVVSIIYILMLIWSEYNYRHSLELSIAPRWLISEKTIFKDAEPFHFIPKSTMKFRVAYNYHVSIL